MRIEILHDRIILIADNDDRADLAERYRTGGNYEAESLVAQCIVDSGWEMIRPEALCAFTDMPLIGEDHGISDDDFRETYGRVWGFPDYVIRDPWEELKNFGRVELPLVADYGADGLRVPDAYMLPQEFGAASANAFKNLLPWV